MGIGDLRLDLLVKSRAMSEPAIPQQRSSVLLQMAGDGPRDVVIVVGITHEDAQVFEGRCLCRLGFRTQRHTAGHGPACSGCGASAESGQGVSSAKAGVSRQSGTPLAMPTRGPDRRSPAVRAHRSRGAGQLSHVNNRCHHGFAPGSISAFLAAVLRGGVPPAPATSRSS